MGDNTIESRKFRDAMGEYATGVTVITTTDDDGSPKGLTANSFTSVSLEPALLLWSLGKDSRCYTAFMAGRDFAVHVLNHSQQDLSDLFASMDDDKFSEIEWSKGVSGAPVLHDFAARFQCEVEAQHEAGDHVIVVGRVIEMQHKPSQPLLYYKGQYANIGSATERCSK